MKHHKIWASLLIVVLAWNWGCQKKQDKEQTSAVQPAVREIVVFSTDDASSGTSRGWTLDTQGMAIYWTKNLGSALFDETTFPVKSQKIRTMIDSLKKTGILQKKLNVSGVKTYSLKYKKGDQTFHLSWTNDSQIPPAFQKWRKKILDWCQKIKEKN